MRAYMSDLDKRSRWLDYLSTHYTATVEETGVSPEDWVLNTAWGEARAIMAETEPESRCPEAVTARYALDTLARSVRHPGIAFTLPHDIQAALAEALAGFIEREC